MSAQADKSGAGREPDVREVELLDETGTPIGVSVRIEPGPATDDTSEIADRIRGWSKLVVDGETYTFSKERAAQLLLRFPHFAATLAKAGKTK